MNPSNQIPCHVQNLAGAYLAMNGKEWQFTHDVSKAAVFDYFRDQVATQLEQARREHGMICVVAPVENQLAHEKCDGCGISINTRTAFYDGSRFLCPACRLAAR